MQAKTRLGTTGWRGVIADDYTFENVYKGAQFMAQNLDENAQTGKGQVTGFNSRFHSSQSAITMVRAAVTNGRVHLPSQHAPNQKAVSIFYSYSHKDAQYLNALADHLSPLRREGVIKEWCDRRIRAGEEMRATIDARLGAADIIILIVSRNFIASDYCWYEELCALKKHFAGEAVAIPVIVSPVQWKLTPLGGLRALPKDGRPVNSWRPQDAGWFDVEEGIRQVVEMLARSR